tara:strand:+ start:900 stop:2267 length:1368 start_codon:yes stop_codon:yes gene_type:complete
MKHLIHNKDYTKEVNSLMNFAQKRMGFSNEPRVLFSDDHENASKPLGKTAYYNPNNTKITIFVTNRHVKDILRSLAHELVHHMQNEQGSLHDDGYMGVGYAQKNPKMREMERQAYEMGNLCFRDWEDSLKQNHPTIYNERRNQNMSLKDWKNKQLMENLSEKWGFKSNLNENMGEKPDLDYGSFEAEEDALERFRNPDDGDDDETEDMPDTPPPMPSNPEGLPFKEQKKYDLEENADRMFAPSHYCAHHVVHEGKKGYTVDHNYNTILKRVTRYDVKFADGTIKRNIHESKLTVLEAFDEADHKRDDHPPAKRDKEEIQEMDRSEEMFYYFKSKMPNASHKEIMDAVYDYMKDTHSPRKASPPMGMKPMEEEAKKNMVKGPDGKMVPDYAADGKGDKDLAKGKQPKDSEKSEEKSDKKESPKKGKMPPGLAKYHAEKKGKVQESLNRKIRVTIKK